MTVHITCLWTVHIWLLATPFQASPSHFFYLPLPSPHLFLSPGFPAAYAFLLPVLTWSLGSGLAAGLALRSCQIMVLLLGSQSAAVVSWLSSSAPCDLSAGAPRSTDVGEAAPSAHCRSWLHPRLAPVVDRKTWAAAIRWIGSAPPWHACKYGGYSAVSWEEDVDSSLLRDLCLLDPSALRAACNWSAGCQQGEGWH